MVNIKIRLIIFFAAKDGKVLQKSKLAVQAGLTNSCVEKRSEKQRRKGKIYPFECRVPKNSKER